MKTPLLYGFGIALAMGVVSLISHILGISTDPEKLMLAMVVGIVGVLLLYIPGIVLGTKQARAEAGLAGFSYGRAFKTGLLISLFAALGGVLFNLFYFTVLMPNFAEVQVEATRNIMERMNAPASTIDQALEDVRNKATLGRQLRGSFLFTFIFGCVVSLITAAVMKRPPADAPGELPPSLA